MANNNRGWQINMFSAQNFYFSKCQSVEYFTNVLCFGFGQSNVDRKCETSINQFWIGVNVDILASPS